MRKLQAIASSLIFGFASVATAQAQQQGPAEANLKQMPASAQAQIFKTLDAQNQLIRDMALKIEQLEKRVAEIERKLQR